jgi:opine dehydrogenase
MEIAIIGGGNGCYAAAAHFSDLGHTVRMWRQNIEAFGPVLSSGKITLTDFQGTRETNISKPTNNIGEAVDGAQLVVVPLPATSHQHVSKLLAPHLQDGQVVYIPPATFGSYIFARTLFDSGNKARVAFAETGTLPYLARKQEGNHVRISVYATRLPTGVFPAKEADRAINIIAKAYPSIEPLQDALDGATMNAGPVIHPPLIVLNAGPLEHFDAWDIHNEGTQPSIRRLTSALDNERISLRRALGYGEPHFPLSNHYDDDAEEWMYGNSSHEKLVDSGDWRESIDLLNHRYMREDTALGLSFWISLADWVGIDMPITKGLLEIASGMTGENLYASGRTLKSLGLDGITKKKLSNLLREGFQYD